MYSFLSRLVLINKSDLIFNISLILIQYIKIKKLNIISNQILYSKFQNKSYNPLCHQAFIDFSI